MKLTLKAARVNKGLTQQDVAVKLKTDHTVISRWENGTNNPSPLSLKKLLDLYGIKFEELDFSGMKPGKEDKTE